MYTLPNGMVSDPRTLLADGVWVSTDTRATGLNNNQLVVGPSGCGKSRGVVMPNIMQLSSSYVVIDPKGALHDRLAAGLADAGYDVRLVDFADPARATASWSPFALCASEQELHEACQAIVAPHGVATDNPYWDEVAAAALVAIVHLLRERGEAPTMGRVIDAVSGAYVDAPVRPPRGWPARAAEVGYSRLDEEFALTALTPADRPLAPADVARLRRLASAAKARAAHLSARVGRLEEEVRGRLGYDPSKYWDLPRGQDPTRRDPALRSAMRELRRRRREASSAKEELASLERRLRASERATANPARSIAPGPHEALDRWLHVRCSADRTWKSILVSLAPLLDQYRDPALLSMLGDGLPALDAEAPGVVPTALFVTVSDVSRDMDLLASLCVRQVVAALVRSADSMPGQRLLEPVRVVLDDFANMCAWPDFDTWVAAVRSRDIWLTCVIQSTYQLRQRYGLNAETILANCDQQVYFAPANLAEAKDLAEVVGREPAELLRMPAGTAYVVVRGHEPRRAGRYGLAGHPNYRLFACSTEGRDL